MSVLTHTSVVVLLVAAAILVSVALYGAILADRRAEERDGAMDALGMVLATIGWADRTFVVEASTVAWWYENELEAHIKLGPDGELVVWVDDEEED